MRPIGQQTRENYEYILKLGFEDEALTRLRPVVDTWTETTRQQLRSALKRRFAELGQDAEGARRAALIGRGEVGTVEYQYPVPVELDQLDAAVEREPANYRETYFVLLGLGLRMREYLLMPREAVEEALRRGKLRVVGKGRKVRVIESRPAHGAFGRLLKQQWAVLGDVLGGPQTSPKTRHSNFDRWLRRVAARVFGEGAASRWSPHRLRHGFALRAVADGMPLHRLQHHLGHASLETTGRYLHANPNDPDMLRTYD